MFDYPIIYKEADDSSNRKQKNYFLLLGLYLFITVLLSIFDSYFNDNFIMEKIIMFLSILIIVFLFLFAFYDYQGKWYSSREVAESIKTICWRYCMRAEPYNVSDEAADKILIDTMKDIINMNHTYNINMSVDFEKSDLLPKTMKDIRLKSLNDRFLYYKNFRVKNQKDWYSNKSFQKEKSSRIFFFLLIIISFTITFMIILDRDNLPIQSLISLLSVLFTWFQTKKYRELSQAYSLAAHEIGFIFLEEGKNFTEEKFSKYVNNTENAFSREHTQWIARK